MLGRGHLHYLPELKRPVTVTQCGPGLGIVAEACDVYLAITVHTNVSGFPPTLLTLTPQLPPNRVPIAQPSHELLEIVALRCCGSRLAR